MRPLTVGVWAAAGVLVAVLSGVSLLSLYAAFVPINSSLEVSVVVAIPDSSRPDAAILTVGSALSAVDALLKKRGLLATVVVLDVGTDHSKVRGIVEAAQGLVMNPTGSVRLVRVTESPNLFGDGTSPSLQVPQDKATVGLNRVLASLRPRMVVVVEPGAKLCTDGLITAMDTMDRAGHSLHGCRLVDVKGTAISQGVKLEVFRGMLLADDLVSAEAQSERKYVTVPDSRCVGFGYPLYEFLGGFNHSYPWRLAHMDFALRAAYEHNITMQGSGSISALVSEIPKAGNSHRIRTTSFAHTWTAIIQNSLPKPDLVVRRHVFWHMECGLGPIRGFSIEAASLLVALDRYANVHAQWSSSSCETEFLSTLPARWRQILLRQHSLKPVSHKGAEVICIIHHDAGRYPSFVPLCPAETVYIIGRSMYETTSIPNGWKENCATEVDEVWVPSSFNLHTFRSAGVPKKKLNIIPELVDTDLFDPNKFPSQHRRRGRLFRFLSVFKFEKRKGWDILFESYWNEFSVDDPVELVLRVDMSEFDKAQFDQFLSAYLLKHPNADKSRFPKMTWAKPVSHDEYPELYGSADCFVLPTRGEGWGLPIMEAMSMGLPVIATNFSGVAEYLSMENGYPLRLDGLVKSSHGDDHLWAQPSVQHLQELMRTLFLHKNESSSKGRRARNDVESKYSLSAVGRLVAKRLLSIETGILDIKGYQPRVRGGKKFDSTSFYWHEFKGIPDQPRFSRMAFRRSDNVNRHWKPLALNQDIKLLPAPKVENVTSS